MKKKLPLQLLHCAYNEDQLLKLERPVVLFLGRSNVGKSSLLNALTYSSLAKVSKAPGKTRSVNYFSYGKKLTLIDLPGYGYAKRSQEERNQWQLMMNHFFRTLKPGSLAFILMDAKRRLEDEEFYLMNILLEESAQLRVLFTKADQLNQKMRQVQLRYIDSLMKKISVHSQIECSFVSVKSGEGIESLRREIYQYGEQTTI